MNEDRDDPTAVLLQLKETLSQSSKIISIYRDMLKYPAFLKEVLSFGRECLLWGIQGKQICQQTMTWKELQKILGSCVLFESCREKDLRPIMLQLWAELYRAGYYTWACFHNQEYQQIFQQLAKKFPVTGAVLRHQSNFFAMVWM